MTGSVLGGPPARKTSQSMVSSPGLLLGLLLTVAHPVERCGGWRV